MAPRPRVRARAAIASGLISLTLAGALTGLSYALVRRSLVRSREQVSVTQTYSDARLVRNRLRLESPDVMQAIQSVQAGANTRIVVRLGTSWFGSALGTGRDSIPPLLRQGVESNRAGHQTLRIGGAPTVVTGVAIPAVDASFYEFHDLSDIDATLGSLSLRLIVAGAVAALVAAGLGILSSAQVLSPLRGMAEVAHRIAGGDLESRLDDGGDADIAPLVHAFNEMLDHLRDRIDRESRFASDVSHELRGPLAVLSSAVDVVNRRRAELPEGAVLAMTALEEQVRSFNQLVLDLLEISRFDAGAAELDIRRTDVVALVRTALEDRAGGPGPEALADRGPVIADVDPRRFHQVVTNLLDNAANYGGGATGVSVRRDEGEVVVMVDDAGPGVPEPERAAIFERFRRGAAADRPGAPRGTGLGLALVAEHVRLHGGSVAVEDSPAGGARFVVRVPGEKAS
jgi:signal transduction histidine kinase